MDITTPLSIILQQGTGYVLFVLACFVIAFLYRELKGAQQREMEAYNHRIVDGTTLGNAYNSSLNGFTAALKDKTVQDEKIAAAIVDMSKSVAQLTYRENK